MACPPLIPAITVLRQVREGLQGIMSTREHKEMAGASHSQMAEMRGALKQCRCPIKLDPLSSSNLHKPRLISTALPDHRDMPTKWALLSAAVTMPCRDTTRRKHLPE